MLGEEGGGREGGGVKYTIMSTIIAEDLAALGYSQHDLFSTK